MRTIHIVLLILLAALIGFSIFGVLVWRAVETEVVEVQDAGSRFQEIRTRYEHSEPMLDLDAAGKIIGRHPPADPSPTSLQQLRVLAYKASGNRLVEIDVPFWFVKLKGPALGFAFRGTGFDLKDLGVTAGDLERHGPGLILDETTPGGDRLLVWTE